MMWWDGGDDSDDGEDDVMIEREKVKECIGIEKEKEIPFTSCDFCNIVTIFFTTTKNNNCSFFWYDFFLRSFF